jgi:hypothetical protein
MGGQYFIIGSAQHLTHQMDDPRLILDDQDKRFFT